MSNIDRFEGYSFYPSPLSSPLFNEKDINKKGKLEMQKLIGEMFTRDKNQQLVELDDRRGLSYLTSEITSPSDRDKVKLYKVIDNHLLYLKKFYKNKPHLFAKDPEVVAITIFKNKLENNNGSKKILGKLINCPSKEVEERFKQLHKEALSVGLKRKGEKLFEPTISNMMRDDLSFCFLLI